mgnify:CR=1 FL=1
MVYDYHNRLLSLDLYNETNSTILDELYNYSPPTWLILSWYGTFLFILTCVLTLNIKMCNSEEYSENFICCFCLIYRDIVLSTLICVVQILFLIYDCICCSFKFDNKKKWYICNKLDKLRKYMNNIYNKYKFIITNSIYPIEATMVENSHSNTSIVIEGLNNNNNIISIIIVPIDEMVV